MGVYIKGMDIPHDGYCNIRLYPSGKVSVSYFDEKFDAEAVEVKVPHGRLIDADALEKVIGKHPLNWEYGQGVEDCFDDLINAPTVLEAEGKDDG